MTTTLVFTGTLSIKRDEAIALPKAAGFEVKNSIVQDLDFLVVGEDAGAGKLSKAGALGIKTITEAQWRAHIIEAGGEDDWTPTSIDILTIYEKEGHDTAAIIRAVDRGEPDYDVDDGVKHHLGWTCTNREEVGPIIDVLEGLGLWRNVEEWDD
jgi:BRCA1 C Terminus (BRCT) domain